MGWMLKPRLTLLLTALLAFTGAFAATPCAAQRAPKVYTVPGEILARPAANLKNPAAALSAMASLGQVKKIDAINGIYWIKVKNGLTVNQAIATLAKRSDMQIAEPNYYYQIHTAPTEGAGMYALQWSIPKTKTDLAWSLWTADTVTVVPATGAKAPRIIGMLDTGVAFGHQDLFSRIQTDASGLLTGYDFVNNNPNPWDDNGHGTMTAGIAAARINDGIGVAGIAAWDGNAAHSEFDAVKIMPLKVMDANGYGSAANIIAGINYARTSATPAHILCIALGAEADSATLQTAVSNAIAAGIVVVAAAGNDESNLPTFPASYAGVVSVASTDNVVGDTLSSFSNYGPWVRVAAPGSDILSTTNNGFYGYGSGTSMAAAIVAGEAALIRSMTPTLTGTQVYNLLVSMVDPYTPFDGNMLAAGAGRANVRDAVLAAQQAGGAGLVSVSVPATMINGAALTASGTVTLANPASGSAVSVVLTWAGTDITVNAGVSPQTVSVPVGQTSATFDVAVANAPSGASVSVTGTQTISGNTLVRSTSGAISKLLNTLTVSSSALKSGAQAVATLTTNVPAPVGGATVTLASSAAAVANPSNAGGTTVGTVVIPAGATSATFYVQAANVTANGTANITATYNGDVKTAAMTVSAPILTGLSASPSTVVVGQTTQLTVTLDGNAGTGGVSVAVTSSNTNIMADPGAVVVPAGQSSVTVASPVTASTLANPVPNDTAMTLTATLAAATPTAVITVRPLISGVSVSPSSAKGGTIPLPVGTVTLSQPAPVGGTVVALTSSNTAVATVPASVTIPAGATTGTFTVTSLAVASDATTVVTATNQFASRTTTFTSQAPALSSLSVAASNILVGSTTTGTVTLDSPAPTGGSVVSLVSSNTNAATVPATVTVAAGSTTGTFTVTSVVTTAAQTTTLTASYGGVSRVASVVVTPLLASVSVSPAKLRGGATPAPTGTIYLNQPAPTGGATVTLASSDPSVTVGANVVIAAGTNTGTFPVATHAVSTLTNVTITAALAGVSRTTTMTITAPAIATFVVNPNAVVGGSSATTTNATITLDSPAPTGGLTIALASNNTAAAQPWSVATGGSAITSVSVPAGLATVTFFVKGFTVASNTPVVLSAAVGSQTVTANMTVQALLTSVTLAPASVTGGTNSTATVTLAAGAPTGGLTLNLSTTNTTVATVPATLVIAAGATTGTFPVTTVPVATNGTVNISAASGSALKSAALQIAAPTVTTLVVAPTIAIYGSAAPNSIGTITMSGKAPASFTVNVMSSNVNVATVPATVTIPAGTNTATFTITSQAVSADSNTVITVSTPTGGGKTGALTVKPMLQSVTLASATTIGGAAVTGTVTLNAAAPVGGTVVTMSSSNTAVAAPPATVTVAAGATTATFTIVTGAVAANTNVTISGALSGATRSVSLTDQTATASTLTLSSASINAGESTTATVTLTGPAPTGGTSITITVTNSVGNSASAPQTVTIPAGATSATFTVSTTGFTLSPRTATITATITGVAGSKTASLAIKNN